MIEEGRNEVKVGGAWEVSACVRGESVGERSDGRESRSWSGEMTGGADKEPSKGGGEMAERSDSDADEAGENAATRLEAEME